MDHDVGGIKGRAIVIPERLVTGHLRPRHLQYLFSLIACFLVLVRFRLLFAIYRPDWLVLSPPIFFGNPHRDEREVQQSSLIQSGLRRGASDSNVGILRGVPTPESSPLLRVASFSPSPSVAKSAGRFLSWTGQADIFRGSPRHDFSHSYRHRPGCLRLGNGGGIRPASQTRTAQP